MGCGPVSYTHLDVYKRQVFTYVGLVLFMTGVNVGFQSLGYVLGAEIVNSGFKYLLVPLAILMDPGAHQ